MATKRLPKFAKPKGALSETDLSLGRSLKSGARIPARERWLYENPEALRSVLRGLEESAEGKTVSRGSFARYAKTKL